jgi:hypothetical protein
MCRADHADQTMDMSTFGNPRVAGRRRRLRSVPCLRRYTGCIKLANNFQNWMVKLAAPSWTFLTNHARSCSASRTTRGPACATSRPGWTSPSAVLTASSPTWPRPGTSSSKKTVGATATRSRRIFRCQNPPAKSAPWARCWPCSRATTHRRDRPGPHLRPNPLRRPAWIIIFREARGGGLTFEGNGERGRAAARACGLPMDPCLVYRGWFAAAAGAVRA